MSIKPRLSTLTFVAFNVNAAIDSGHMHDVSFDDIYKWIEDRTLLTSLERKIPGTFDFSLFPPASEQNGALIDAISGAAAALQGRERRKSGVENSGLCLLMALLVEAIQQQYRE